MTREEAQAVIMNEQKCIDRADRCNRDCGNCDLVMDEKIINEAYNFVIKALEQPERKTGKWIPLISTSDRKRHEWCGYQCSICGERTLRLTQCNFCPNCGSYNGGEQE